MKNYGNFSENGREYIITDPLTPEPWINYLGGTENLNMFVSNGAGGTIWYDQPHTGRLTRYRLNGMPMDAPGFYLYLKDGNNIWNPSYFPVMKKLDSYQCRHGMGYTCFESELDGLKCKCNLFIPLKDDILLWDITLTNCTEVEKDIRLYPYLDYSLHDFDKDTLAFLVCGNQVRYRYDSENKGLLSDYFAFESQFMGKTIFSANVPFDKFDLNRNDFIGRGRTEDNPIGLEQGLKNSEIKDGGFFACGVFELKQRLLPGEEKRLVVKLAANRELDQARKLTYKYNSLEEVDYAFSELKNYWEEAIDCCQVYTPNTTVNNMLNVWFPKNISATICNGRSISHRHAGDGTSLRFRDTMQDIMPGSMMFPRNTRKRILCLMHSITNSGRVVTNLDSGTLDCTKPEHTRSDAIVWGIFTIYKYLAETGDFDILETEVKSYEGQNAKVLALLVKGMKFVADNTGANGLPYIFDCDWNDMLQVFSNAAEGGESIMLAEQFIYAVKLLNEILECVGGNENHIAFFKQKSTEFAKILASDTCWDGEWFKRLLFPNDFIGGAEKTEGKIFLNSQSWAAISNALPENLTSKAMDKVAEILDTDCGIKLFSPPFTKMIDGITPFNTNTPGAGENGGLFLHANTWAIIAETVKKNPQRAWKYFSQVLPPVLSARNPKHYAREPYAFASWVYGPDHEAFGHAALTWLTGGAAWMYIAGNEYILGIRPTLKGLLISPCIPPEWDIYRVIRKIRGALYRITVVNPERIGCGKLKLSVSGKPVQGNLIPYIPSGESVEINVVITPETA